ACHWFAGVTREKGGGTHRLWEGLAQWTIYSIITTQTHNRKIGGHMKKPPLELVPPPPPEMDILEFLNRVVRGDENPQEVRVTAAIALLPYLYEAKTPLRCPHCGEYVYESADDDEES